MPEGHWKGNRSSSRSRSGNITINNLGRTSYILLAAFCGLALGIGVGALAYATRAEREARLLEYYVMELDGKLMRKGLMEPGESWSAQKRKHEEEGK